MAGLNLAALAGMMGGGAMALPEIPCAVCLASPSDVAPLTTITLVLGTPVCGGHAVELVRILRAGVE